MTADRKNLSDGELRKLLNLGDPAGDGNEPAPEELNSMRRTVLNAIDTSPAVRPWLSRPYVTAAAMVTIALIALTILLRAGPWGAVLQPETGPIIPAEPVPAAATEPTPTTQAESVAAVEEDPDATVSEPFPDATAQAEAQVAEINEVPDAAVEEAAVAAAGVPSNILPVTVAREPRTVQFTAPGGTRIIWTLDPEFQLPLGELDDRARGEL